ncbi:MAG: M48 family metalloprotease [Campylobacteraceae bacterium]|jgi:Zn-dependent protease with chaperone function|nr:M48 family metalloprotease [Campylobacteraceae bacterium]
MNFYKEQERSKRYSVILALAFILSVIIVVFAVGMIFITINVLYMHEEAHSDFTLSPFYILKSASWFAIICSFLSVFFVIAYGAIKKNDDLAKGGDTVANELGGKLLLAESANKKEKILINVVDEISIASGISSPPIYIMENKHINAFVAGTTYDNTVLGITRGAIELLEREELQGVVAHEFSHIFNGDIKLNNYTTSFVSGIMYIFLIGMEFIFPSRFGKIDDKKIEDYYWGLLFSPIAIFGGFILAILGSLGMALASFIQFLINHQREFFADASAVQFTRYPQGIANALKKVGQYGYKFANANVGYYSHIFFATWSSPATDKRIYKIEPRWNGKYINTEKKRKEIFKEPEPKKPINTLTVAYLLNQLSNIGNIDSKQLLHAKKVLDMIPQDLKQSAKNPLEAEFIIYALLFDADADTRRIQAELTARKLFPNNPLKQEAVRRRLFIIYDNTSFLERAAYLDIIHICTAALKAISSEQYATFKELANELTLYDKHISTFEWCIKYIVFYPLDMTFGLRKPPLEIHTHVGAFKKELEILLSAVAYTQCKNDKKAAAIFDNIKKQSGITSIQYMPYNEFLQKDFIKAIDEIQNSKPLVRRKVMETAIMILGNDNEISHKDLAVIHALSEALHLPLGIEA